MHVSVSHIMAKFDIKGTFFNFFLVAKFDIKGMFFNFFW